MWPNPIRFKYRVRFLEETQEPHRVILLQDASSLSLDRRSYPDGLVAAPLYPTSRATRTHLTFLYYFFSNISPCSGDTLGR